MRVLDVWEELETGINTEEYIQTGFGASDVLKDYFSDKEVVAIVKEVFQKIMNGYKKKLSQKRENNLSQLIDKIQRI